MNALKVLVACERSGVVRRAFRALGHSAWSCDLKPADDGCGKVGHIIGDALEVIAAGRPTDGAKWDLMIAHPPCTHLSLSGARWCADHWVRRKSGDRWHDGSEKRRQREAAAAFFRALWEAPVPRICLENPMSMASTLVAPKTQEIHPWQFGHGERKTTWLWLKNLPLLKPTNVVEGREERIWRMPPGPERERLRSITYEGIARAMAEQWSVSALSKLT